MHISQKLSLSLSLSLAVVLMAGVLAFAAGPAAALPSEKPFEIEPGSFHFTPSTGQAGAHSNWTTAFDFAHNSKGNTFNDARNIVVNLPAGFDASNTAVPTCNTSQLLSHGPAVEFEGLLPACPLSSEVGRITLDFGGELATFPIFNMEVTSFGVTAVLGFRVFAVPETLIVNVRPGDTGLSITSPEIESLGEVHDISVTIWGVPGAREHDLERQQVCLEKHGCYNEYGGPQPDSGSSKPYLSNPTSCGSFEASMKADSWEDPAAWSEATTQVGPIRECERVSFEPSVVVQPTTRFVESPSGLDVSLVVPQSWSEPETIATANLKDTTLALPVGITANPSLASGLGACTPAQYEAETSGSLPGEGCPAESKIGSIEIETPLLTEKIDGAVYIAKPFDNPFDSLLGLYIVARDPTRGVLIKAAGKIEPNPVTGQLVTTFGATPAFEGLPASDGTPQQPFSRFTLKFRPGATAPLVSPPACGTYTAQAALTPWSDPLTPRLVSNSFQIENGIGGGTCPAGGIPPFHPSLIAGTLNNSAGSYSPMDIHIARNDGEQEITRFSSILPPGLTANLSGIPFCPDANIEAAKLVTGAQEEAAPSCSAASEIGHSLVGAGVGSVLAYTPGKIYLAGPYNGAPFSVVSITSAKVGPFDLGTVVIRFALEINPETGVVTVDAKTSDPIPHIIKGIVIHVRDIHVYVDRSNFMINPTNCDPENFAATVGGGGADPTNPADQQFVTTNDSFQLADCQNLQFKPKFSVSTSGKTSKADGASLTAKLVYPTAPQGTQADIKEVKVDLPKQLPSRLTTLQKACTAAQFNTNPAGCPTASVIGHARAITPILPVPLEGPAYFVSHGGEAFPDLEIVLQGYGVKIVLTGNTFISKAGITSSTFKTVPDEPVTSFELTLPEGPDSALAANGNLCSSKLAMPTEFVGQNGAQIRGLSTPVTVTGCPKTKKTLTRTQKLAAALKACHKNKNHAKRTKCERLARKKYVVNTNVKGKKHAGGKKHG